MSVGDPRAPGAWTAGSAPGVPRAAGRRLDSRRRRLVAIGLGLLLVVLVVAWMTDDTSVAGGGSGADGAPVPDAQPEPGTGDGSSTGARDDLDADQDPSATPDDTAADDAAADDATSEPADGGSPTADGLVVLFLDVGQGEATLLMQGETTVLIDTGRYQANDVVETVAALGIEVLDLVIVTHPHADHIGQFDRLGDAVGIVETWWSGATTTSLTFGRALDALERSGAAYEEPRSGDAARIGELLIEVANPPVGVDLGDVHDSGLAVRVTYGSFRMLFTGDAEAATERRMVALDAELLEAELLQVGHHGSRTSTDPEFLAAVSPAVAVYSARAGNSYGHPHREVLEMLSAAGAEVYGTDIHGTVAVTTDGQQWSVQTDWESATAQVLRQEHTGGEAAEGGGEDVG